MNQQADIYRGIIEVHPLEDYRLLVRFDNGEERVFDLKPYLEMGRFAELKDMAMFQSVRISFDTIEWANHLDLDPEFVYAHSKQTETA